ncbi:Rrf2 family transcriptional regulator [Roseomonas marmotae]|nr:Rrf2 family transcriptional regulator [Roseomonas marmotae]QTI80905.1 Rrf2 family transcriptional regulator [Roseomonas marmotae]
MMLRRDRAMVAVSIMLDVGFHAGRGSVVPAGDIAERLGEARRGIEPVLQALSRAGLLGSTRGPKGGYRLGRAARDIRLSEVVAAVSGGVGEDEAAEAAGSPLNEAVVVPLWAELEAGLAAILEQLTLAELLRRAAAQGLRRPTPEALNFAI